jgi:hypothetical protein
MAKQALYSPFVTRHSPFSAQIPHIWPVFGPVFLDSRLSPAISPANPARGFLALFVFA